MTRHEHIAEAERLAQESADYFRSARQLRQQKSPGCSRPHADRADDQRTSGVLAKRALVHATLAVALGQPSVPQQNPVAQPTEWEHRGVNHYRRGEWELSYVRDSELTTGQDRAGWHLYGPGVAKSGYCLGFFVDGAQAMADRWIATHLANPDNKKAVEDAQVPDGDRCTVGNLPWTRVDGAWSVFGYRLELRTPPGCVPSWYLVRPHEPLARYSGILPCARSESDALAHATGVLTLGRAGYADEATG